MFDQVVGQIFCLIFGKLIDKVFDKDQGQRQEQNLKEQFPISQLQLQQHEEKDQYINNKPQTWQEQ